MTFLRHRSHWTSILVLLLLSAVSSTAASKTIRHELTVRRQSVNLSGLREVDFALTVNGGIPAPTLEFTEGDDAEILVKNASDEDVSIHWHGILLPPLEDGVSYLTTPPILPGSERRFKFHIRQHGTYWYHSHTRLQEQKGVFGAIIIHPKHPTIRVDREVVAILSDWSDENPDQILNNLRKDGDYYRYKKNSIRSYFGALIEGMLGTQLINEWQRMGGMDLSDVGYDRFLINGKWNSQLTAAKPGERIRLRIINAGASTYFHVSLADQVMNLVSSDGVDVSPLKAQRLLMGMGETLDVLFLVPEVKSYELRATAQDGSGFASAWIGEGERVRAPELAKPPLYARMDHSAHAGHVGDSSDHEGHKAHHEHHQEMALDKIVETATVDSLRAAVPDSSLGQGPIREVRLVLGGSMERYVWHINGKPIHEDRDIPVKEGERLRLTFANETMMHHPMHLHGHFFRVLNGQGEYSPLKHTVDVPPHGSREIELVANEPGQWMLHCHNLYHMKNGMARVMNYITWSPSPEIAALQHHDPHHHDHLYHLTKIDAATNLLQGSIRVSNSRSQIDLRGESRSTTRKSLSIGDEWENKADLFYRRWQSNYLSLMGGPVLYENRAYAVAGLGYTLPLLIESRLLINHEGHLRLDLERAFQWTSWLRSDLEIVLRPGWGGSHEGEFTASLVVSPRWTWAAGLYFTEKSVGLGVQARL